MNTFVYSDQKPEIKLYNDKEIFVNQLMKKSSDVNIECNGKIRDNNILETRILNEIAEEKSLNNNQLCEFLTNQLPDKTVYHNGYLKYLLAAWHNDCGIEIGPWNIWTIILHELCKLINNNPDKYRFIFTKSNDKTNIFLHNQFNINVFIDKLKEHIPFDTNMFFPKFENPPQNYTECVYGQFAETIKKYYDCSILCCSIPKVRITGTKNDWNNLLKTIEDIESLFSKNNNKTDYLVTCAETIKEYIKNLNNSKFWSTFFYLKHCGSGSQEVVKGHVTKLLLDNYELLVSNIPDMISRYPFIDSKSKIGVNHNYISGIMFSSLDNEGILVPEYYYDVSYMTQDKIILNPEQIKERKEILEILNLLKHFSTKSNGYINNHYTCKHSFLDLEEKSWDDDSEPEPEPKLKLRNLWTYEKYKAFYFGGEGLYSPPVSEDYKLRKYNKYAECINKFNKIMVDANFDPKKYDIIINEERKEQLVEKFNVWKFGIDDIKKSDDTFKITNDDIDYIESTFKDIFDKIYSSLPTLYKYCIENNCFDHVYDDIVETYNIDIYKTMLTLYFETPYKVKERDGYNYYDPLISYNKMDVKFRFFLKLLFDMYKKSGNFDPSCDHINNLIKNLLNFVPEFSKLLVNTLIEMMQNRIEQTYNGFSNDKQINKLAPIIGICFYGNYENLPQSLFIDGLLGDNNKALFFLSFLSEVDTDSYYNSINETINSISKQKVINKKKPDEKNTNCLLTCFKSMFSKSK
jgi:hypothetical protein